MKIAITNNNRFKSEIFTITIPQSWAELIAQGHDAHQTLHLLLNQAEIPAKIQILKNILKLNPKTFNKITDNDIAHIIAKMDWLKPDANPEPIIKEFQHTPPSLKPKLFNTQIAQHPTPITYHLPAPRFENGTALEFALADDYFKKIIETGDQTALLNLCATLCREPNTDQQAQIRTGDTRTPLNTRAEVEHRAKALATIDPTTQVIVFLYFAGVKTYIHQLYATHIFQQPEPIDETQPPTPNPHPSQSDPFGWWGIFMELAENPINLPKIHNMNFHELCLWLVRSKMQNDKMKQLTAPTNFKNND